MRSDLEVRHCRALVAVGETGGVVAAARRLGVSQSTVSETLLAVERLLGAPILQRQAGRAVQLTPAAAALIPHARAVIAASEAAAAAFAGQGPEPLRLGAVESVTSFLLPAPLRAFRARWPGVEVQVAIGLCHDLVGRVGRGELDAAVTLESAHLPPGRAAASRRLAPMPLQFVVGPGADRQGPLAPAALIGRPLLLADAEGAFTGLLRDWLGHPPGLRLDSAGSIDGVKRGVMDGEAVGVLPAYAVTGELASGALRPLALSEPPPPVALYLTSARPPGAAPALDALLDEVERALAAA